VTTTAVAFAVMVWVLVGLVIGFVVGALKTDPEFTTVLRSTALSVLGGVAGGLIVVLAVHPLPGLHGFELLGGSAGGATIALLIHAARARTQPRHRTPESADRRRPG